MDYPDQLRLLSAGEMERLKSRIYVHFDKILIFVWQSRLNLIDDEVLPWLQPGDADVASTL